MEDREIGELRGASEEWPEPSESMGEFLLGTLRAMGDRLIQIYPREGVEWKARDIAARAEALATAMAERLGVGKDHRVCFLSACHPQYSPFLLASWLLGATFAPLNPDFDKGDLERLLGIIQPKVVFCEPSVVDRAESALRSAVPSAQLLLLGTGDAWSSFDLCASAHERAKTPFQPARVTDLREAIAALMCSSGTTGLPKCVIYTHYMMRCSFNVLSHKDSVIRAEHKVVFTSPGFWLTGLFYAVLSMGRGIQVIYKHGSKEEEILAAIEEYEATGFFTANNFLVSVAKVYEANPSYDISSLKHILCGGAAMNHDTHKYVQRVLGKRIVQAYGMTEMNCGTGLSMTSQEKQGAVGSLCANLRCKIVDPVTGETLGRNKPGELRFKSPCITPGYLNNPEATAELFDEKNWLKTGDIGYVDEDGYFFISGRLKEIIKYKGVHVSPSELEGVLNGHSAVLESAVVGVPHPTEQELPRAYVVLRPGAQVTDLELIDLVKDKLADHKHLRGGVHFVEELPKTSTGKISRTQLRKIYGLDKLAEVPA